MKKSEPRTLAASCLCHAGTDRVQHMDTVTFRCKIRPPCTGELCPGLRTRDLEVEPQGQPIARRERSTRDESRWRCGSFKASTGWEGSPSSRRSEGEEVEPQSGLKRLSPSSSFLRAEGGASKNTETKRPAVFSGGSGWLEHKTFVVCILPQSLTPETTPRRSAESWGIGATSKVDRLGYLTEKDSSSVSSVDLICSPSSAKIESLAPRHL